MVWFEGRGEKFNYELFAESHFASTNSAILILHFFLSPEKVIDGEIK